MYHRRRSLGDVEVKGGEGGRGGGLSSLSLGGWWEEARVGWEGLKIEWMYVEVERV